MLAWGAACMCISRLFFVLFCVCLQALQAMQCQECDRGNAQVLKRSDAQQWIGIILPHHNAVCPRMRDVVRRLQRG